MLQIIDADGDVVQDAPVLRDPEVCRELFRWMLYVRAFDSAALSLQRSGRISFCNPSTGEEASQIGSVYAISPEDWIFPSYRVAGAYLFRCGSPLRLFNQLFGNTNDLSRGRQMPMHFADKSARFFSVSSPVGTQITQAVGMAYAARLKKASANAVAYFGDGATSTNDFHAGLNLAGVLRAPVVFCCVNNQYAISVPLRCQTASETLASKAIAYGMTGVRVDGNDVLAVYTATGDAAAQCRRGDGPVLLEIVTYRAGPHSSSDNTALYRSPQEEQEWRSRDPIERLRRFLQRKDWWSAGWEDEVKAADRTALQEAIDIAEQTPPPGPDTLFQDVWAEPVPSLKRQERRMQNLNRQGDHVRDYRFPI